MAVSNSLSRSINYASQVLRNIPVTGINNIANEPALTIGDWVRQFILSPPFKWRWNRATAQLAFPQSTQTVVSSGLTNFGFLEKGVIKDVSNNYMELKVENLFGQEANTSQPKFVSSFLDDPGAGNITFSIFPPADQDYTLFLTYQKAAPLFVALTDKWTPVPDYLSYLYNQGVVAKYMEYKDDSRQAAAMQLFVQQLVAASEGLDELQKNIFMSEYINTSRQTQRLKT